MRRGFSQLFIGRRGLLLTLTFTLFVFTHQSRATTQSVYSFVNHGTGPSLAMGGVATALSEDASGLFMNPAGLAWGPQGFDFDYSQTRLSHEQASRDPSYDYSLPVDQYSVAATYRTKSLAFAAGLYSPYALSLVRGASEGEWRRQAMGASLSAKMGKKVTLGLAGFYEELSQDFEMFSLSESEKTQSMNYRAGFSYRDKGSGLGLYYSPAVEFEFDRPRGEGLGYDYFELGYVPAQWSFGIFHHFSNAFMLAMDLQVFELNKDGVYPGSVANQFNGDGMRVREKQTEIFRVGAEWTLTKAEHTEVVFRFGAYTEPPQYELQVANQHFTYGLEVRFGPAVLSVAYDQADDFTHSSQGFSLLLSEL